MPPPWLCGILNLVTCATRNERIAILHHDWRRWISTSIWAMRCLIDLNSQPIGHCMKRQNRMRPRSCATLGGATISVALRGVVMFDDIAVFAFPPRNHSRSARRFFFRPRCRGEISSAPRVKRWDGEVRGLVATGPARRGGKSTFSRCHQEFGSSHRACMRRGLVART